MTAQFSESLLYEGEWYSLCSCPLSDYFKLAKIRSPFREFSTACWRGYIGTWEIKEDRLYLTNLKGRYGKGEDFAPAMELLFPDFATRVFAHWFTGTLRIPIGQQIEYVHLGFSSKYEKDLFIKVKQGLITSETIKENS